MVLSELRRDDGLFLRALGRAPGTCYLSDLALRRLAADAGDVDVGYFTAGIAAGHVAGLWSSGLSARSVRRHVACLRATWRRARLRVCPWSDLANVRVDPVELRIVSVEEERLIRRALRSPADLWFALGIETGARAGELSSLRAGDVLPDREASRIAPRTSATAAS